MRALELPGRTVLITGAGAGIGRALAIALHARGANVVTADIDVERADALVRELDSPRAVATALDVTDAPSCASAVALAVTTFGRLDVVVANAGLGPPAGTMLSADPVEFDRVLAVNLSGVVHTVRAALPEIVRSRGHVLIVSSIYAAFNGVLAVPYAMSKAAVEQLGRALRVELAPHGASVGVAYLGFVDTGLVDRAFAAPGVTTVRSALPAFITRPAPLARLVPGLIRSVERRRPAFRFPSWVTGLLMSRGMTGPLFDAVFCRDPRVRRGVREAEQARPPREMP